MISHELSLIQHNSTASAELKSLTDAFIAQGGSVVALNAPPLAPKPPVKEYGRQIPKLESRPVSKPKQKLKPGAARINVGPAMIERLKALAPHMSKIDAVAETGLSRHLLDRTAMENGIEFRPHDRKKNLKPPTIDPIVDALNVVRLKAARDQGLARKQAAVELGISGTVVARLIRDYQINYPICPPGKRR